MKQKFSVLVLLAIACATYFVQGQKREFQIPQEPPHIPFGQKLPPPQVRSGEVKFWLERGSTNPNIKAINEGMNRRDLREIDTDDQRDRRYELSNTQQNRQKDHGPAPGLHC